MGARNTTMGHLDAEYLRRDGGNAMEGPLRLWRNPVEAFEAATRAYMDERDAAGLVTSRAAAQGLIADQAVITQTALALMLRIDGSIPMTGPLTLPGVPINPLEAATKSYVDALPPGQMSYDAVVDAGGGADYTDIVTACATEPVGATILVNRGTYNETANIVMKDGQMLTGQNPEDTIIDFGAANRKITPAGAGTNRSVVNLTVQGSIADRTVEMNGTYDRVENCRILGTVNANTALYMSGDHSVAARNFISGFTKNAVLYAIQFGGSYCTAYANSITSCRRGILLFNSSMVVANQLSVISNAQLYMGNMSTAIGNTLYGNIEIVIAAGECRIIGNQIRGNITWNADHDWIVIEGNGFVSSSILCNQMNSHSIIMTGNYFSTAGGIEHAGYASTITGNTFQGSAHLQFSANSKFNVAAGNAFHISTEPQLTRITDLGLRGNQAYNNQGVPVTSEKKFLDMKNTSGAGVVDGDVVTQKAVAAGNEFDTTVNQGDDLVLGMANETIANNAEGIIQTLGKVVTLKVNGVINIAIGDLLGTFTAVGIAQQAQAGDMAFAIALEVYAGADSMGVIDALLITPRKV